MKTGNHPPVLSAHSEIYNGETIDAREEKKGWALPAIMIQNGAA
jgi:hypothetical protein